MKITVLNERKYKGLVVRDEIWDHDGINPSEGVTMVGQYYNRENEWIGSSRMANYLLTLGIYPQKSDPSHCVCSIGFSSKDNKWYGWSHRAICGFGIGDKLFDIHWTGGHNETELEKMPYVQRGETVIENLEQAKQAAINFAEHVS